MCWKGRKCPEPASIKNSTKKKPETMSNSTSPPAHWKKPTIPSACTCARWGRCRCLRAKAYKKAGQLQEKFANVSQKKRPKDYRRARLNLARGIVRVSLCVRNLGFTNNERKRLIERVNKTVDTMRSLDRQSQNLERRAEQTRSEEQKKEYRRQARSVRAALA